MRSRSPKDSVRNFDQAIENDPPDTKVIDAFLRDHTWAKRFDVIEEAIEKESQPVADRG